MRIIVPTVSGTGYSAGVELSAANAFGSCPGRSPPFESAGGHNNLDSAGTVVATAYNTVLVNSGSGAMGSGLVPLLGA